MFDDDLTIPDFLIATEEKHLRAWRGFKVKKPAPFIAEDKYRKEWLRLKKEKQRKRLAELRERKKNEELNREVTRLIGHPPTRIIRG